jgi:Cyclic phosphodiesterase-like protein
MFFTPMATREEIITYWLCPAEPARSCFAEIINELAVRFDAPVFEPHVTIFVTNAEREKPGDMLAKVLPKQRPYRFTARDVDYSDKFTQTLFVRFAPHAELTRLGEDLRRASASQSDYELNPHLSLLYKTMDPEIKRQLADSIVLPFADVTFDIVKAVLSPARIESRADVESWRVVAEEKLAQ